MITWSLQELQAKHWGLFAEQTCRKQRNGKRLTSEQVRSKNFPFSQISEETLPCLRLVLFHLVLKLNYIRFLLQFWFGLSIFHILSLKYFSNIFIFISRHPAYFYSGLCIFFSFSVLVQHKRLPFSTHSTLLFI